MCSSPPPRLLSLPDGSSGSAHLLTALQRRQRHRPGQDLQIGQLQLPVVLLPPRLAQDRQLPESPTLPGSKTEARDVLKSDTARLVFLTACIVYQL